MEAMIVVLLVAVLAAVLIAAWMVANALRRPSADTEAQRLEQQTLRLEAQLAAAKNDLAQAVTNSQQALFGQVNAVDAKLNQRLDAVSSTFGQRMDAVDSRVGAGFSAVKTDLTASLTSQSETMGKIGEQLGGLDQAAKRMAEVEQTLGRDVSSLKEILQPPKLRGVFGELRLEQLLQDTLPAAKFSTQHRFSDNSVVDFVIQTPDGLVPIDSKFPLETFKRLLEAPNEEEQARQRRLFIREMRARVDEVAKYVRPDEGTLEFAIMYLPAENIYYEALVGGEGESVMTYALERHVHLASPNTFHALLQTIRRIFVRIDIQRNAMEIQGRIEQLKREYALFREGFRKLGGHLSHAKSNYDDLDNKAARFADRLSLATQSELPALDEALQAPLPQSDIAPAPLVPSLTNGNGHVED
jgi:DNA recombination protein RmuC